MMDPFDSVFFRSDFGLGNKKFDNKELVLNILLHRESIIMQYLIFKIDDLEEYLIIGFDFIQEEIIPVEKESINVILKEIIGFTSSKYNTINFTIENIPEAIEYFSSINMNKMDFYTYKNITFMSSNQRNVMSCESEVYNNQISHKSANSVLLLDKSSLLYGKINIKVNQSNVHNIQKIHLTEDVIMKFSINGQTIDTAGIIYEAKSSGSNTYMLTISSFMHELVYSKLGHYSSQGLNIHSHMNTILRTTGMEKEQINIEGYEKSYSPYLVIIPLENLSIIEGSFGLGDINFHSKQEILKKYKGINKFYSEELHGEFETYAQTIVESDNTYNAYQIGLKKIRSAIDIIILFSKNDRIYNLYNLGKELNEWSRLIIYQNPECSTFYYVESITLNEKIFSDSKNIRENTSLVIDSAFNKLIKELEWYEESLYKNLINKQSLVSRQLFNAVKWLNRSWKTNDIEDKIIYTNISMEFLVSEVKTEPFIPKEIVREFKRDLKKILKDKDIYTTENSNKIKDKSLSKLSDPPLKIKVKSLISQLEIPITNEEFDSLWEVRLYRNDLVHGRDNLKYNSENVLIANIILGELISYRLRNEEGV